MLTCLVLVAAVASPPETRTRVLAESGRDYRDTRLYTACSANLDGNGKPLLVVGGFSDTGNGDVSDLFAYELNDHRAELRWRTMWKGGTKSLIRTVRAADLDGDGRDEVIVLGRVNDHPNHRYPDTPNNAEAQLKVLGLRNGAFNALGEANWQSGAYTHGFGMELGDFDGNGLPEIVTGGFFNDGTLEHAELRVWRFERGELRLISRAHWGDKGQTRINSIAVGDVDGDGVPEIVTAGRTGQIKDEEDEEVTLAERAQLTVWRLQQGNLVQRASYDWANEGLTRLREARIVDVDGDGHPEIVGAGRSGKKGQPYLCVLRLAAEGLVLAREAEYPSDAVGEVKDLAFYGQGPALRIVTIGAQGRKPDRRGQLQVWKFIGDRPELVRDQITSHGDETRVRRLLLWPNGGNQQILTVGFMRNDQQDIGQVLSWGLAP